MAAVTQRHGLWMQILMVIGVIFLLAGVAVGLPRSFKPEVSCPQGPTASKAQSKLWFNDGLWWGILFDGFSEEFHIYRYDRTEDTWKDTGILVDARNTSRSDALQEDGHLYVVSAGTEAGLNKDSARFLRYSYPTDLEDISFEEGRGTLFMQGPEGVNVGDATSTKQSLDEAAGLLVVASDKNRGYHYNLIDLRDRSSSGNPRPAVGHTHNAPAPSCRVR